jgi:hypothetical protein
MKPHALGNYDGQPENHFQCIWKPAICRALPNRFRDVSFCNFIHVLYTNIEAKLEKPHSPEISIL